MGRQNKLLGAVAQTDNTEGFVASSAAAQAINQSNTNNYAQRNTCQGIIVDAISLTTSTVNRSVMKKIRGLCPWEHLVAIRKNCSAVLKRMALKNKKFLFIITCIFKM